MVSFAKYTASLASMMETCGRVVSQFIGFLLFLEPAAAFAALDVVGM